MRAAERRLASATAREGVAAAELFPQISITGFLGLLAGRGNLFNVSDSRAWAVTPALSWAAFDIGSARARLRGVEGATRESIAEFEQVVLRALEETENALVNYREEQERLVRLADQARESTRAATIARVAVSGGRRRFPGAARRGTHATAGRGRRRTSRGRRVHERHRGLQGPRRNPDFVRLRVRLKPDTTWR